jgi:hypothetical protein
VHVLLVGTDRGVWWMAALVGGTAAAVAACGLSRLRLLAA